MIKGEQGEGFIYEMITDNTTSAHIKEITDDHLKEATLVSSFKDISPMGVRDLNYNIEAYEENTDVSETGDIDMDTGMDNVHPCSSFQCCSSF